jgi:hypothetical protein
MQPVDSIGQSSSLAWFVPQVMMVKRSKGSWQRPGDDEQRGCHPRAGSLPTLIVALSKVRGRLAACKKEWA